MVAHCEGEHHLWMALHTEAGEGRGGRAPRHHGTAKGTTAPQHQGTAKGLHMWWGETPYATMAMRRKEGLYMCAVIAHHVRAHTGRSASCAQGGPSLLRALWR